MPKFSGIEEDEPKQGRPSREDRAKEKFAQAIWARTDKKGRTRAGQRAQVKFLELQFDTVRPLGQFQVTVPKRIGSAKIYSGKSRSFEREFMEKWWAKQPQPWICYLCECVIDPNGKRAAKPSIDHRTPWSQVKLEVPSEMVCCRGIHWEVTRADLVRAMIQDETNLFPSHQGCNSSKNGTKLSDSIAPQRRWNHICPGDNCPLPKAT